MPNLLRPSGRAQRDPPSTPLWKHRFPPEEYCFTATSSPRPNRGTADPWRERNLRSAEQEATKEAPGRDAMEAGLHGRQNHDAAARHRRRRHLRARAPWKLRRAAMEAALEWSVTCCGF